MKNNILYRRKNRKGFTLAELLMTVAILLGSSNIDMGENMV